MHKKLFICGDSFGSSDPAFSNQCWVDHLSALLDSEYTIINLSRVCASNLHISLQVDLAIKQQADYIIYLATSSTRDDVRLRPVQYLDNLLLRLTDLISPTIEQDLTSYSIGSLDRTTKFTNRQLDILKEYHSEFFDIDLYIYRNKLIIESTLQRLHRCGIPFKFDQGGFEHPSFVKSTAIPAYFDNYKEFFSKINLWDYVVNQKIKHRPYYHIQDPAVHQQIAKYYYQIIQEKND